MSVIRLHPPLTAKDGGTLKVIEVCRVSDTTKQDERSPDEQGHSLDEWLSHHTDVPHEITRLSGTGSGELLTRKEYVQLIEMIETGRYDVVLCEDLGRIVRRIHAHLFCELCVDHNTRLLSPFVDQIDTAVPGWQDRSIFSAWHHERSNRDTSQRIRRAQRARFVQGGCISRLSYGYRLVPGALEKECRTVADVEKVPEAVPVYATWFRMLEEGALYAEIADWLNETDVPLGPHAQKLRDKKERKMREAGLSVGLDPKKRWTGPLVCASSHNTILKGLRIRNKRCSKRINSTGQYRTQPAEPDDLIVHEAPHLAFFEPAYYDEVIARADERNAKYKRSANGRPDTRKGVPKKRVRFPGQAVICGICGRPYVFGGHGQRDHLMCNGAREHVCWNGVSLDGPLATERIASAVIAEIEGLAGYDAQLMASLHEESLRLNSEVNAQSATLDRRLTDVAEQLENVAAFIRRGDDSPTIRADLKRLEQERSRLEFQSREAQKQQRKTIVVPPIDEVRRLAIGSFQHLAMDSLEFATAVRRLIKRIVILPYRFFRGTPIVLRGQLEFSLVCLLPDQRVAELLSSSLRRVLHFDFFVPAQPVAFREQIVELRTLGNNGRRMSEREAARKLGITTTAAQHAAALDRAMKSLSLNDPYLPLTDPPHDLRKFRRHLHPRYQFRPLPGFPIQPW